MLLLKATVTLTDLLCPFVSHCDFSKNRQPDYTHTFLCEQLALKFCMQSSVKYGRITEIEMIFRLEDLFKIAV